MIEQNINLSRIAKALERIANAIEESNKGWENLK